MEKIDLYIESLVFASDDAISPQDIKDCLKAITGQKVNEDDILQSLEELREKYRDEQYTFELVPISRGWQFMSKGAYHHVIGQHLKLQSKKKLSRAALEVLAIIAYKQPITKTQIEQIRGVNCDYTVQKLMEKELIEVAGRDQGPGRPLLYGTSEKFMDHFGIQDVKDLPKLKEINVSENISTNPNQVFDLEDAPSESESENVQTNETDLIEEPQHEANVVTNEDVIQDKQENVAESTPNEDVETTPDTKDQVTSEVEDIAVEMQSDIDASTSDENIHTTPETNDQISSVVEDIAVEMQSDIDASTSDQNIDTTPETNDQIGSAEGIIDSSVVEIDLEDITTERSEISSDEILSIDTHNDIKETTSDSTQVIDSNPRDETSELDIDSSSQHAKTVHGDPQIDTGEVDDYTNPVISEDSQNENPFSVVNNEEE